MSPSEAKKNGRSRKYKIRKDWEEIKETIMYEVVKAKFTQNNNLLKLLLDTKDFLLEEGNNWGDDFWGTVNGNGENKLGKILMQVRKEFSNKKENQIN